MTYQEFIERFKEWAHNELSYDPALMEFYSEGYTSEDPKVLEWIIEANKKFFGQDSPWLMQDFLLMKVKGDDGADIVQRIAIRKVYEDAEKDGFESAVEEIRSAYKNIEQAQLNDVINKRSSGSYEAIREQLILRPLNYGGNIQELHECVYNRIGDVALVLYQLIGNAEASLMSSKIKRDELERWGVKREKVMQDALENTAKIFPASTYNYTESKEVNFLTDNFTRKDISEDGRLIVLSTFKVTNGTAALFYPGVVEKMIQVMGGSFIAVFANINDVLIFDRKEGWADKYLRNAKYTNPDLLSARKYICDERGIRPE